MIQTSYNRLVVQVDTQFNDELTFASGVKLYIETKFDPQEKVSLIGVIHSLPKTIKQMPGQEPMNLGGLKPGDRIMMRYDVLSTTRDQPDRDSVRYRNEFWVEGKKYWFCDIEKVFAVERDGRWVMMNDYIMVEPIEEDRGELFGSLIIRPEHHRIATFKGRGNVLASGLPWVDKGDTIYFNHAFAQEYELNNRKFYIIRERHLVAKDVLI